MIDHFEYIWQRTHGMDASKILRKYHLALRQDAVLYLYEQTFLLVPIFSDMNSSFFRILGLHVDEAYYLRASTIIRLNDIIDTIFIIHKGSVTVVGPDGSIFAVLKRGWLIIFFCNCSFFNPSFLVSSATLIMLEAPEV